MLKRYNAKMVKYFLIIAMLVWHYCLNGQGDTTIVNGILYLDKQPVTLKIAGGTIAEIIPLQESAHTGLFVAPGFIDIQINGFMGVNFSDQELTTDKMQKAAEALWKEGVTSFMPTIITNDRSRLEKSFSLLARAVADTTLRNCV